MVDQGPALDAQCPSWASCLGYVGVAAAVCMSNWGSAVGIIRGVDVFPSNQFVDGVTVYLSVK